MRLVTISLVVGVVIVGSCNRKPDPETMTNRRKEQMKQACASLASQHNASLAWTRFIDPNHIMPLLGNPYTIEVQNALTKNGRIVCVGTLHDILQGDNGYTIHLSYGYDMLDTDFPAFPVMFILACAEKDATALLSIPTDAFRKPKLVFVADVNAVEKVVFKAVASDSEWIHGYPFLRDSFEVNVKPGRAFLAYGRCVAFKEVH